MMKTITTSMAMLLFFMSPQILQAQQSDEVEIVQQPEAKRRIDAFDLVHAAYRGRFKDWGIPAYARLDQAYRGRQITGLDLVEAAIEANQLSAIAIEDKNYVEAVDTNLYGLVTR